jgi:hypothetical protein
VNRAILENEDARKVLLAMWHLEWKGMTGAIAYLLYQDNTHEARILAMHGCRWRVQTMLGVDEHVFETEARIRYAVVCETATQAIVYSTGHDAMGRLARLDYPTLDAAKREIERVVYEHITKA